jgi:hypothetical protein
VGSLARRRGLICTGGSDYFSAGTRQPDGRTLPEWPLTMRVERRRIPELSYMDRSDTEDPILWAITVQL